MIVLGEQGNDSALHIHVSILPQTPLPSRLPHNIEQSFLRYTVGPIGYPFKYSSVYMLMGFPGSPAGKESACNAGGIILYCGGLSFTRQDV